MKIKAVCAETGLSDRTIRYYIDEGLITPQYTENYLGRIKYDFSQEDITALKHVATLCSYYFTVDEIRCMLQDSSKSQAIIQDVRRRMEKIVSDDEKKLDILMQLDAEKEYTVEQLTEEFSQLKTSAIMPCESDQISNVKRLFLIVKRILMFLVVWIPIVSIFFAGKMSVSSYRYPVCNWRLWIVIACLLPPVLILIGAGFRFWKPKFVRVLLVCLSILLCPIGNVGALLCVTNSETTNIHHYRLLEARCSANRDLMFQELFPSADEYCPDRYYYFFEHDWDEAYLIFAEEVMREEVFSTEVARATRFFEENQPTEEELQLGATYTQIQKGRFQCLVIFKPGKCLPMSDTSGKYYVFAYDPTTRTVRYFHINNMWDEETRFSLDIEW